ncbi:MAG: hypothetical protein OSB69_22240 [Alphaproteobacteria bacterium]|nr:hypothetical protein [Alphaproteobacteria bacterium]
MRPQHGVGFGGDEIGSAGVLRASAQDGRLFYSTQDLCLHHWHWLSMIKLVSSARKELFADFVCQIAGQDRPWIFRQFIFSSSFERSDRHFLIDWLNRVVAVGDDLPKMC